MNQLVVEPLVNSCGLRNKLFPKRFVLSAGVVLAITGIAKIWSGLGNAKFLAVVDPIISIKFGQLMLLVGAAEIVIVHLSPQAADNIIKVLLANLLIGSYGLLIWLWLPRGLSKA